MITSEQIRAARLLLHLSPDELAERTNIGVAKIKKCEATDGALTLGQAIAIRRALERAGVVFVDENGQEPGVRLRK